MRSDRSATIRRRFLAAGLAAGVLAGAALGAGRLGQTTVSSVDAIAPEVLHAAPAVVSAGARLVLQATAICEDPTQPACTLARAAALVRPWGADGWTRVDGRIRAGTMSFDVPGMLIPPEGFSYWLDIVTTAGVSVAYPPGGESAPIRVVTTAGLPEGALRPFSWNRRADPQAVVLRLRSGQGDGQVGFTGAGTEDGVRGPSSFDVGARGRIAVADPVNRRLEWFDHRGEFLRAVALPTTRPVDIAAGGGFRAAVATLGTPATAYDLNANGVRGSYPVAFGIVSRVVDGALPRVRVGAAQWVPYRGPNGAALGASATSLGVSSVPMPNGRIGAANELQDGRLAVVWTRPDGSRGGVVLRLPAGISAGADYFVEPLADGGALVARGLWDDTHFGVGVMRIDATGRVRTFALLPEPSHIMAPYSTVRSVTPRAVLLAVDAGEGIRLERFTIGKRRTR